MGRARLGRIGALIAMVAAVAAAYACSSLEGLSAGGGDAGSGAGDAGDASSGVDAPGSDDGAPPPPGVDAGDAGGTGADCNTNVQCRSGVCVPLVQNGGALRSVCSAHCKGPTDCVPGWACMPLAGDSQSVCQCAASAETCDGKDNDCNGIVDDEPIADQGCRDGGAAPIACVGGQCACAGAVCDDAGTCVDTTTDRLNCGACGARCPFGSLCVGSQCVCSDGTGATGAACPPSSPTVQAACVGLSCALAVQLASANVESLAVANDVVLYTDGIAVRAVPKDGGASALVAPSTNALVATDGVRAVYIGGSGGALMSCPIASGCPGGTGATQLGAGPIDAFTVSNGTAYWVDGASVGHACATTGCSATAPLTFGDAGIASPTALAADSTGVYAANRDNNESIIGPQGVVASHAGLTTRLAVHASATGEYVYWCPSGILAMRAPSGATTVLSQNGCTGIATDAARLYWVSPSVHWIALDGTGSQAEVQLVGADSTAIGVDATDIYLGGFGVWRMAKLP